MRPLPIKPQNRQYDIPDEKVQEYERLKKQYQCLNEKSLLDKWLIWYILVFVVTCIHFIHIYEVSYDFRLVLIVLWAGVASFFELAMLLFFLAMGYAFFSPLLDSLNKRYTITKSAKILKQLKELEPIVHRYEEALREYHEEMKDYERMYSGIKLVNYNREQFIKNTEPAVISKLSQDIDYLASRAKIDWWYDLTPFQFEHEVAEWFRRKGYDAKTTSYVGDGGVDIVLKKGGETIFVQCKHYKNPVGVAVIRELLGVVIDGKASNGILVCLCTPSQGAIDFANKNSINIITAHQLSQSTVFSPNYNKEVKYIAEEAYIGSTKPYMYVGDIGVLFNIFYNRKDVAKYLDSLAQYGLFATDVMIGKFYYVICSKVIEMHSGRLISYINTEPSDMLFNTDDLH